MKIFRRVEESKKEEKKNVLDKYEAEKKISGVGASVGHANTEITLLQNICLTPAVYKCLRRRLKRIGGTKPRLSSLVVQWKCSNRPMFK